MKRKIEIFRTDKPNCTVGSGYVKDDGEVIFKFKTLELPWRNNERRVSCIPKGAYKAIKHQSPKFKESFWLQNVPGRSEILVHVANFTSDLLGCIAPGQSHTDINGDGIMDVTNSRKTMTELYKLMPDAFEIHIS